MVEHLVANERVEGSNLFSRSIIWMKATLWWLSLFETAIMDYRAAIKAAEEYRNNGQSDQAIKILLRALQANPKQAGLMSLLAFDLTLVGKPEESLAFAERAVRVEPNNAGYRNNLACSLLQLKRYKDALPHAAEAIRLDPGFYDAYLALAGAHEGLAQLSEAIEVAERAVKVDPKKMDAYGALGQISRSYGDIEKSLEAFRIGVRRATPHPKLAMAYAFTLNFSDKAEESEIQVATKGFRQITEHQAEFKNTQFPNEKNPSKKIRIGYVSPDFRQHSVASFVEPLLIHHDKSAFEVWLYHRHVKSDEVTKRLKSHVEVFRQLETSVLEVVYQRVLQDQIDILVDLSGLTEGNSLQLFARKPSPVQMTMIGYCNTTGIPAIDYRVVDARTDPDGAEARATEELLRVPGCFLCYQAHAQSTEVAPLPSLKNGYVTFGSFNQIPKLTPTTIKMWSDVLNAVPNSRMLIKSYGLDVEAAQTRLKGMFAANGIEPERFELRNAAETSREHLATYGEIDIALDTFPYHGTTTTCEALYMGVPVISRIGVPHRSRVGLSLLSATGHPEWAAANVVEVVTIAKNLTADLDQLAGIRSSLRAQMESSRLMDGATHTRELETLYRQAWTRWCTS